MKAQFNFLNKNLIPTLLIIIGLLLTISSCKKDEEVVVAPDDTTLTIDEIYEVLGDLTGGESTEVSGAGQVPDAIMDIISGNAKSNSDIVFLIDETGSMSDDIAAVKAALNDIIDEIPSNARMGAATYTDNNYHNDWYLWNDLSTDHTDAAAFIQGITIGFTSGGDEPESVYDAIYETANKMSWNNNSDSHFIIVIGDANPQIDEDKTDHSLQDVIDICRSNNIDANLFPILIK